jgi:hypothetical protein
MRQLPLVLQRHCHRDYGGYSADIASIVVDISCSCFGRESRVTYQPASLGMTYLMGPH